MIHTFYTFSPLRSDNDFIEMSNKSNAKVQPAFSFQSHFLLVNRLWNILSKYAYYSCAYHSRALLATRISEPVDNCAIQLFGILCSINVDNLICTEWLLSIFENPDDSFPYVTRIMHWLVVLLSLSPRMSMNILICTVHDEQFGVRSNMQTVDCQQCRPIMHSLISLQINCINFARYYQTIFSEHIEIVFVFVAIEKWI